MSAILTFALAVASFQSSAAQLPTGEFACGPASEKFKTHTDKDSHPEPSPVPDKALVYVVRPTMFGQAFNSDLGFAFFEWIDDADRNILLCATGASTQAVSLMLDGKTAKARSLAQLSQSCMDMSSLLYTVSENAGALGIARIAI
jgi:hypothetical protein